MTRPRVRFSQVPHELADVAPDVWDDDHALAAYVRMKRDADRAWPHSAAVPAGVPKRVLAMLGAAGLVVVEGRQFLMPEVEDWRGRKSEGGRKGADRRWSKPHPPPAEEGDPMGDLPDYGMGDLPDEGYPQAQAQEQVQESTVVQQPSAAMTGARDNGTARHDGMNAVRDVLEKHGLTTGRGEP